MLDINLLGDRIKELRKQRGLTQNAFADALHVSFQAVSRWENSVTFPDITMLPIIANMFNVNVNDLKLVNNKNNNNLMIGEKLIIPNLVNEDIVNTFNYVIKSGDTLYNLAKRYNTSVSEIKNINSLNSNILSIGQVLKIPN